jgi:hypothetical protein
MSLVKIVIRVLVAVVVVSLIVLVFVSVESGFEIACADIRGARIAASFIPSGDQIILRRNLALSIL